MRACGKWEALLLDMLPAHTERWMRAGEGCVVVAVVGGGSTDMLLAEPASIGCERASGLAKEQ